MVTKHIINIDLNCRPEVSESTALPNASQPLSFECLTYKRTKPYPGVTIKVNLGLILFGYGL